MSTLAAPPPTAAPILPETMDEFITRQLIEQGYPASEEHKQKVYDYYERECLKALEGKKIPYTPDFFDKIREEVRQRLQEKQREKTA